MEPIPQAAEQKSLPALRLGAFVEQRKMRPHVPDTMTDGAADDRGHFYNGEQFPASRPVALAGVAYWIEQRCDCNSGNIVDRGRGVTTLTRDWHWQDSEMRSERHHFQIRAVSEKTGNDSGVSDPRKRSEHAINRPMLARHE